MNFKKILSLALLLSSSVFAGECCEKTNFYILTESGWSWPTNFKIDYDESVERCSQSQTDKFVDELLCGKPCYSYVISAEVGVEFNNWLSLGSSFNLRPLYEYCQSAGAIGNLVPRKVYFTLSNMSFMYIAAINRGINPCWSWECGCFRLAPFVSGGVGLSYTTFGHLVFLEDNPDSNVNQVFQDAVDTTTSRFAWQAQVGLEASYADRLSFGVSYRFFDAGKWSTITDKCCISYLRDYVFNTNVQTDATYLCGKLRANELVFNLMINF